MLVQLYCLLSIWKLTTKSDRCKHQSSSESGKGASGISTEHGIEINILATYNIKGLQQYLIIKYHIQGNIAANVAVSLHIIKGVPKQIYAYILSF